MTQAPQLRPLGPALGTEALGIDLSKPLGEGTFAWIQGVFAEHPVLVFRDQDLSAPELAAILNALRALSGGGRPSVRSHASASVFVGPHDGDAFANSAIASSTSCVIVSNLASP